MFYTILHQTLFEQTFGHGVKEEVIFNWKRDPSEPSIHQGGCNQVGGKRNEETEKRSMERVRNTNYGSEKTKVNNMQ